MILLFTSEHCAWCDILRRMLEEESEDLGSLQPVFEVDVDRHQYIAEAYSILVVPTLVAGLQKISGVPTQSDLRSFLLHMNPVIQSRSEQTHPSIILRKVCELRVSQEDDRMVIGRL